MIKVGYSHFFRNFQLILSLEIYVRIYMGHLRTAMFFLILNSN